MVTDVTLVLYGFDAEQFRRSLTMLNESSRLIGTVRILVSGTAADHEAIRACLRDNRIEFNIALETRLDNLGFATGHNRLLARAFDEGAEHALVLNPDVGFSPSALDSLIESCRQGPVGLYGPTLERDGQGSQDFDRVADSLGIGWNRWARHYDIGQGAAWTLPSGAPRPVQGVTGACLMVSAAAFSRIVEGSGHFFDDLFIAFREDAELGVRAALLGIPSYVVPVEGFLHVRSNRGFERSNPHVNMLGVRNRFLMRSKLGARRPGSFGLALARDIFVVAATFAVERTSIPGLRSAWAVRRFQRGARKRLESAASERHQAGL